MMSLNYNEAIVVLDSQTFDKGTRPIESWLPEQNVHVTVETLCKKNVYGDS